MLLWEDDQNISVMSHKNVILFHCQVSSALEQLYCKVPKHFHMEKQKKEILIFYQVSTVMVKHFHTEE